MHPYCGMCGNKVKEGLRYCPNCGASLAEQNEPESPAAPQPSVMNAPVAPIPQSSVYNTRASVVSQPMDQPFSPEPPIMQPAEQAAGASENASSFAVQEDPFAMNNEETPIPQQSDNNLLASLIAASVPQTQDPPLYENRPNPTPMSQKPYYNKKKLVAVAGAVSLVILIVVIIASVGGGKNSYVGTWVLTEYPETVIVDAPARYYENGKRELEVRGICYDVFTLNEDGTGLGDGYRLNWYVQGDTLTIENAWEDPMVVKVKRITSKRLEGTFTIEYEGNVFEGGVWHDVDVDLVYTKQ